MENKFYFSFSKNPIGYCFGRKEILFFFSDNPVLGTVSAEKKFYFSFQIIPYWVLYRQKRNFIFLFRLSRIGYCIGRKEILFFFSNNPVLGTASAENTLTTF